MKRRLRISVKKHDTHGIVGHVLIIEILRLAIGISLSWQR